MIEDGFLKEFVAESNRIEGIHREPSLEEMEVHRFCLDTHDYTIDDLKVFVGTCAGAPLRSGPTMNVRVGNHVAPRGGEAIESFVEWLLLEMHSFTPKEVHDMYLWVHPFMDGNGRSSRALWLRCMKLSGRLFMPQSYGFLHSYYYQSLDEGDDSVEGLLISNDWEFN